MASSGRGRVSDAQGLSPRGGVEGEDVRARIVNVERLTDAAAKVQKGLRVFVRDETPLESIAALTE
jgi:hypothetical protein